MHDLSWRWVGTLTNHRGKKKVTHPSSGRVTQGRHSHEEGLAKKARESGDGKKVKGFTPETASTTHPAKPLPHMLLETKACCPTLKHHHFYVCLKSGHDENDTLLIIKLSIMRLVFSLPSFADSRPGGLDRSVLQHAASTLWPHDAHVWIF